MSPENHADEIPQRRRFPFGKNWAAFLKNVDQAMIDRAKASLLEILEPGDLDGKRFIDVGSGSGLFSLAARLLGARVWSLDLDPRCVRCAGELKTRYLPDDDWEIDQRSALDPRLADELGRFDVVYSWGVLHHTGRMWDALENVARLVADGGLLFVAIYNDQGRASVRWRTVKRLHTRLPRPLRPLVLWPALVRVWGPTTLRDLIRGKPFHTWRNYGRTSRGMRPWTDLVDWVGGYPFEVAKPEEVCDFCRARNLELRRLKTCGGGRGCNQFHFKTHPLPLGVGGGEAAG